MGEERQKKIKSCYEDFPGKNKLFIWVEYKKAKAKQYADHFKEKRALKIPLSGLSFCLYFTFVNA